MHVYLAAACPQCRSTTMVVTNQDDAWGKDHAINCGVCGRRVIAAGQDSPGGDCGGTARWTRRSGPTGCGTSPKEGVDSLTMAEGGRRRAREQGCRRGRCGPLRPGGLAAVWPGGESRTDDPR